RHTRSKRDWSSDVCSSDLEPPIHIEREIPLHCPFEPPLTIAQSGVQPSLSNFPGSVSQYRPSGPSLRIAMNTVNSRPQSTYNTCPRLESLLYYMDPRSPHISAP